MALGAECDPGPVRGRETKRFFRGGERNCRPDIYEACDTTGIRYAIRVQDDPVLERRIERLPVRPEPRDGMTERQGESMQHLAEVFLAHVGLVDRYQ